MTTPTWRQLLPVVTAFYILAWKCRMLDILPMNQATSNVPSSRFRRPTLHKFMLADSIGLRSALSVRLKMMRWSGPLRKRSKSSSSLKSDIRKGPLVLVQERRTLLLWLPSNFPNRNGALKLGDVKSDESSNYMKLRELHTSNPNNTNIHILS